MILVVGVMSSDLRTAMQSRHSNLTGRLKSMQEALISEASTSGVSQSSLKISLGWSEGSLGCRDLHDRVSRIDSSAASLSSGGLEVADDALDALQEPYCTLASEQEHTQSAQPTLPRNPPLPEVNLDQCLSVKIISSTDSYQALESCDTEGLEPDLIIVLGPLFKLRGYPPHHSRVSELIHCPQSLEGENNFDEAVNRFMSIEQRFGR